MDEKKPMSSDRDVEDNKVMAALSYLFVLCFIPLLMSKDSKFAQFHAKQGLVLFIVWVVVLMVSAVPLLGWILAPWLMIAMLIISTIGLVMAVQGKWYKMPIVADLAEKIKL